MKARVHIEELQAALRIPVALRAPRIGPLTRGAFERLASLAPEAEFETTKAGDADLGHAGEGARDINENATKLIQHFESCYLKAYKDSVGVWTVGYGHTGLQHKDGTVYAGRVITQAKADQLFAYDMQQFEARVEAMVKVQLTDDQFGAVVAWDFNTGGLGRSTLLKKLNIEDYAGAAQEFLKWDKAGGSTLRGLTRRRHSERRLFLGLHPFILDLNQLAAVQKRGDSAV
jgi:lysozyme